MIIMFFVTAGLLLGAFERHSSGDGTIAFILFGFGLFQLLGLRGMRKQYLIAKKAYNIRRNDKR